MRHNMQNNIAEIADFLRFKNSVFKNAAVFIAVIYFYVIIISL